MSSRESQALSKFVNEEFSFLSEQMEKSIGGELQEAECVDSDIAEPEPGLSDNFKVVEKAGKCVGLGNSELANPRVQSVDSGVGLVSLADESLLGWLTPEAIKDTVGDVSKDPVRVIAEVPVENLRENSVGDVKRDPVIDVAENLVKNVREDPLKNDAEEPVEDVTGDSVRTATESPVSPVAAEFVESIAIKPIRNDQEKSVRNDQEESVRNDQEESVKEVSGHTVSDLSNDTAVNVRAKDKRNLNVLTDSDDCDDDRGVYDESFRGSKWIFVKEDESEDEKSDSTEDSSSVTSAESGESRSQDSYEYRRSYKQVSFKKVQRQSSLQTFAMEQTSEVSAEKKVTLTKSEGEDGLGFHIGGTCPTVIGHVVPGSVAEKAGLEIGDVLLAINYERVLTSTHPEIVEILRNASGPVTIELCKKTALTMMSEDQRETCNEIYSAYMHKLVNSTFGVWKKRWFVLKSDNCLYYYREKKDREILGAIPLSGYMVQKAIDMKKPHSLKLMHRAKTYYLAAANEEELFRWAKLLTEATQVESSMDNWVAVSAHHVSLPSYAIKNMDCDGFLYKLGGHHKSWKRRYCVLKDGCLFYYCEVNSRCAQGVAHLHGYTTIANPPSNKKNMFELSPPDPKMRTFHFYADTQMEKDRWIRAMKLSISRWVQVKD